MNSRLFFIWFIFLFSCPALSLAQNGRLVQGKISDSTHNALPGVTVKLFFPGSKDTLQTISGKNGLFSFIPVASSRFTIRVSSSEYEVYSNEYLFADTAMNIQLDVIILRQAIKELKEMVLGVAFIQIREDTIEYKADSISLKADASVEDLLKKLPGIQVNKNGFITAQGKQVYKVRVNGKDFFGTDVKMATRELPANIIDKIQVINDYGEEAAVTGIKTDEPVKVINLKLKKDKQKGVFGSMAAGYGSSDTYQAKLNTNFFSDKSQLSFYGNSNNINNGFVITNTGSAGMNMMMLSGRGVSSGGTGNTGIQQNKSGVPDGITTTHSAGTNFRFDFGKKNSFYGSYNFSNRNTKGFRELYQQNIYPTESYFNYQWYDYKNKGNGHQAYLNMELYPDSMSYLKISPEIFFNNGANRSSTEFVFYRDTAYKTSEGYMLDRGKMKTPDIGVNILYNRSFHKRGRNLALSLTMGSERSTMETNRPNFTRYYDAPGSYFDSTQDQHISQNRKGHNYIFYLAYTEPVSKNKYIDLTYSHDFSKSDDDRDVYLPDPVSNNFKLDSGLSNQYTNRYINDRIGIDFRSTQKKYNYTIGISLLPVNSKTYSYEKDTINNQQHILNVAPSARFSYTLSGSKNLSISYNGINRQPGFMQLQPARDISNPQFQREGNPDLKPEFAHNLGLSYNSFSLGSGSSMFSSLGISTIDNKIVNNTILLDTSGAQLSRPENTSGFYGIYGFYNYSKPYQQSKYILRLNGSAGYNHDVILVNSESSTGNNWFLSQGFEFNYNNNKWLEFGIEASYTVSAARDLLSQANNFTYSTWTLGNNLSMNLPGNIEIKYDFETIFNKGLVGSLDKNINVLNISAEKKLLKKKNFYLRFSGYNILNQISTVSRVVTGNTIMDSRSLQLSRYFLFTLTYRWNKFGS